MKNYTQENKKKTAIIKIYNTTSILEFPDRLRPDSFYSYDSVLEDIALRLSYLQKVYRNGKTQLVRRTVFKKGAQSFLTGFLPYVKQVLEGHQFDVIIQDLRRCPKQEPDFSALNLHGIKLRDYQERAIREAIKAGRGILDMSVGAGKTEVAAGIIQTLQLRTLFIVHTKVLLYQTQKRLQERLGVPVGIFGDGVQDIQEVTVASIQSLYRHLKTIKPWLQSIDVLFVDEAHHISNNSYRKVLVNVDAFYRFGLSGTPLKREDDRSMYVVGTLGNVVIKIDPATLIAQGYLSKTEIRTVSYHGESGYSYSSWGELYSDLIVTNESRNRLIVECTKQLLQEGRKRIMVIVREVEHGNILQTLLESALHRTVPFFWSKQFGMKERLLLTQFSEGRIPVIIVSPIFDEGVDVPTIDTIVLAGGGKSFIKTIQRVGRGMRVSSDKDKLVVVDFIDYHHQTLFRHSTLRLQTYKAAQLPFAKWDWEPDQTVLEAGNSTPTKPLTIRR